MEIILHNNILKLSIDNEKRTIRSSFVFLYQYIKKYCVVFSFFFLSPIFVFADYTIPSGTTMTVTALQALGLSGTLTINGILSVDANKTLLFTSVVMNGSGNGTDGQMNWTGNNDLTFPAGTTIDLNNSALGLQPTAGNGNSSTSLYIGTVLISTSSDNGNADVYSFEQFNGLGGLPQFNISSNAPVCLGSQVSTTVTPSRTSSYVYYYNWSISGTPGGSLSSAASNSTGAGATSITPSNTGSYTVTCIIKDVDNHTIATKTTNIVVNTISTITHTSSAATSAQSLAINTPITSIVYSIGGSGTGATLSGAPPGISGSYSSGSGTFTITGTPTAGGIYTYTVAGTGATCSGTATGSITVSSNPELKLFSGVKMKMNGAINLILNNTGFNNNGTFSADVSTVKFTGDKDTTIAYVKGTSTSTFYNLSSSKTSYGLVLKSSTGVRNVLDISAGHLYTDSNLTLLSDANLTARLAFVPSTTNIVGKAMVQRYMPPRRAWRLLTAPVTSSKTIYDTWQNGGVYEAGKGTWVTGPVIANGIDDSPERNYSMKAFNYNTQAFTNISNTKVPISSGTSGNGDNTGYFIFVRGDRVFNNFNYPSGACTVTTLTSIGNLQTQTQTFTTAKDSAKYTLIGNPYASPVNFSTLTRNNLVKRFFVLDPTIGTVGAWVMLDDPDGDGVYSKSIGLSSMSENIQSGQAFLVVTNANVTSASIVFNESNKSSTGNSSIMGRPMAPNRFASIRSNLYLLDADTAIIADGNLTEYDARFSSKTDLDDASKPSNTNENLTLIRNGLSFSVERRSMLTANDTIFFKTWRTTQRQYRLEFIPSYLAQSGLQGYLEDSYLQTSTPVSLSVPTTYDFSIDGNASSQAFDRFRIVFKPAIEAGPLPVTISKIKADLQVNNTALVEWVVENEVNIVKYELERSADGVSFSGIAFKNTNGNNNATNTYDWVDENILLGNNFYRIKIYESNGQIKYSTIVKIISDNKISDLRIYPNPVTDRTIHLLMNNQPDGMYKLQLINNIGQILYESKMQHSGLSATHVISIKETQLITGNYKLRITKPDKTVVVKSVLIN